MTARTPAVLAATVLLFTACGTGPKVLAQTLNDTLAKACAKPSLVMNQTGDQVGRRIDPYCRGFLEASLEALLIDSRLTCMVSHPVTPDYLLSVYQTFLIDFPAEREASAARVARASFERAFSCSAR